MIEERILSGFISGYSGLTLDMKKQLHKGGVYLFVYVTKDTF